MLFTLRPLVLETKGLSAALRQYGERLRETETISITVKPGSFGNELDTDIAAAIFSIIDEAVSNARRHASSAAIDVVAEKRDDALVATVRDHGRGFDVNEVLSSYDQRVSVGLRNMRERATLEPPSDFWAHSVG